MQREAIDRVGFAELPPQVDNLARREKEVAELIYVQGPMTAKVLEERLERDLSNSAIRAMLGRLCRKGILKRTKLSGSHRRSDRRIPYLYAPALTEAAIRQRAIKLLARDYFNGSITQLADAVAFVVQKETRSGDHSSTPSRRRVAILAEIGSDRSPPP